MSQVSPQTVRGRASFGHQASSFSSTAETALSTAALELDDRENLAELVGASTPLGPGARAVPGQGGCVGREGGVWAIGRAGGAEAHGES